MSPILDLVEWVDESGGEIVHRVPEVGSGEFRLGSQVVVRDSQRAVFVRDGRGLDVFQPGRHTLSTANIPLLADLIGIVFGGRSPFRAEVIFVSMRQFLDMKWGTAQPIIYRDSELGMVQLRGFGQYAMEVADPQLFVTKIVGTQGALTTADVADYLRGIIVAEVTTTLSAMLTSIVDLAGHYTEIGQAVKAGVQDDFAALGLTLRTFVVGAITPPEKVQAMIDERSSMGAIGNMQAYMQFKAAQALGDAARAEGGAAGAMAGLGAGAGLGAAFGQMIGQAVQQPAPTAPPAPPAPAVTPATGGSSDRLQQLKTLGELKAAGVLTDAEFEAEKQRILGGG
ncbi:MAG: SPFH domain-containing protein [Chloroflexi bacterium]|nr:SPFH domain-containing protein [Chloroflexota bacterium]